MKKMKKGFTLVEIMIVVAIIGLLAAIAIPSFARARNTSRKNACINNLRQIDSGKDQFALENSKVDEDSVTLDEVCTFVKGGIPKCPAGGTYTTPMLVKANPTCSIGGDHKLPTITQ